MLNLFPFPSPIAPVRPLQTSLTHQHAQGQWAAREVIPRSPERMGEQQQEDEKHHSSQCKRVCVCVCVALVTGTGKG